MKNDQSRVHDSVKHLRLLSSPSSLGLDIPTTNSAPISLLPRAAGAVGSETAKVID
jgi:hypothetical protein